MSNINRFSEFSDEKTPLEGDKIKIDDVLNQEVIVNDFTVHNSKFEGKGRYTKVQIKLDGITKVIFTGSEVIANQCEKYKQKIPFIATIKKLNKYYTFT